WDVVQNVSNAAVENGIGNGRTYEGTVLTSNVNNHMWYGGVTNFQYDKIENLSLNAGGDLRFYRAYHFQQITDFLGLEGFIYPTFGDNDHLVTESYRANPW